MRDLLGMPDQAITAERDSSAGTSARRVYDKLYGGIVVEWEWSLDTLGQREHAASQALEYLANLRKSVDDREALSAAVCDGATWGFLIQNDIEPQLDLFGAMPRTSAGYFEWVQNSENACRRLLELIESKRKQPITATRIAAEFGPQGNNSRVIPLLLEALLRRTGDDRTDVLFKEWRRDIDVVYGTSSAVPPAAISELKTLYNIGIPCDLPELLYAVHTYLSIIAKLFAAEVLARAAHEEHAQPTRWVAYDRASLEERLRHLDSGRVFESFNLVENLLEPDLFSWWLDHLAGNLSLLDSIRSVIATLEDLAFPPIVYGASPSRDVLRDLFHELLPRQMRKALGEFLTPAWLAEACLERMLATGADLIHGRVLDPTCGTGTFLMPVVRARVQRLRATGRASYENVSKLLDSFVGFDINPIAVTAARVNVVLALGDLANLGAVTLPIWRADSINIPRDPGRQTSGFATALIGKRWKELKTSLPDVFPVPVELATSAGLARLREAIESSIQVATDAAALSEFERQLSASFGPDGTEFLDAEKWNNISAVAGELFGRIRKLHNAERDGVWARIIENSFAPVLSGRFEVVVGNPPWISWTRLPQEWRDTTSSSWKRYGLWRIPPEPGRRTRSHATSDIATLVYATAVERYCAPGGCVGLLVPKALVTADPGGRAFRQFWLHPDKRDAYDVANCDVRFAPLYCDDWSTIKPFSPDAANMPIFFIARRDGRVTYPIPVSRWLRKRGIRTSGNSWPARSLTFSEEPLEAMPVSSTYGLSAWDFRDTAGSFDELIGGSNEYMFGKGLDTRGANGVYFVEILTSHRNGRVIVANQPALGRDRAVTRRPREIDARLVYPLLRGKDVRPWVATPGAYVMAPYAEASKGGMLSEEELRQYPGAYEFLSQFKKKLQARKPPPRRKWDLGGVDWYKLDGPFEFMFGSYKVVVRELEHGPSAAIVRARYDDKLGRTATTLVDHKLCYSSIESEENALYLVGMINSSLIQRLLKRFANSIANSPQTLARLPIPPFSMVAHFDFIETIRQIVGRAEQGQDFKPLLPAFEDEAAEILRNGSSKNASRIGVEF